MTLKKSYYKYDKKNNLLSHLSKVKKTRRTSSQRSKQRSKQRKSSSVPRSQKKTSHRPLVDIRAFQKRRSPVTSRSGFKKVMSRRKSQMI